MGPRHILDTLSQHNQDFNILIFTSLHHIFSTVISDNVKSFQSNEEKKNSISSSVQAV